MFEDNESKIPHLIFIHVYLLQAIFFGGLDPRLRQEVWPFLLHSYDWSWSSDERQMHRQKRAEGYEEIASRRKAMSKDEEAEFWRSVQCTVEKDVVRTDRSAISGGGGGEGERSRQDGRVAIN